MKSASSAASKVASVSRAGGTPARAVAAVARRVGLTGPAFRTWELYRAAQVRHTAKYAPDGLPLPPPLYMIRVVGPGAVPDFWASGREVATEIQRLLARQGRALGDLEAFLDFGCGCGRVLRHWVDLRGPRVCGSDYNPQLVRWVLDNLRFVDVRRNLLVPPLPYPDASFDFVYALSVFTHLGERLQREWLAELRRILRPDGLLMFTTQGEAYASALDRSWLRNLRADFEAGRLVVIEEDVEGTNRCSAYHPHAWVESQLLDGFELVDYVPSLSAGFGFQDGYLVRNKTSWRKSVE